jgi:hypothetical protein
MYRRVIAVSPLEASFVRGGVAQDCKINIALKTIITASSNEDSILLMRLF